MVDMNNEKQTIHKALVDKLSWLIVSITREKIKYEKVIDLAQERLENPTFTDIIFSRESKYRMRKLLGEESLKVANDHLDYINSHLQQLLGDNRYDYTKELIENHGHYLMIKRLEDMYE